MKALHTHYIARCDCRMARFKYGRESHPSQRLLFNSMSASRPFAHTHAHISNDRCRPTLQLAEARPRTKTRLASSTAGRDMSAPKPEDEDVPFGLMSDWKKQQKPLQLDTQSQDSMPSPQPAASFRLDAFTTLMTLKTLSQLGLVVGLLFLFPAWLHPGGLAVSRVWHLYFAYIAFFAVGTVPRMASHGKLAPARLDRQRGTIRRTLALLVFILSMPLFHWTAVSRYLYYQWYMKPLALYDVLAATMWLTATCLHGWAAYSLGKDFDRLVTPSKLVTTGPYRIIQHPIYTSYMLLFTSMCFALRTLPTALLMLAVCLVHYNLRCSLERGILLAAFKEEYRQYSQGTKKFIPLVV